jgi:hypothetical protein
LAVSMSWTKLLVDQRVASQPTSKQELDDIRQMIATNLNDANVAGLSSQGRYEFAYNAARLIATVVIRACGYRVISKTGHHYFTFQALEAADAAFMMAAAHFDAARRKRNDFSYDTPVSISETDADELVQAVQQFQQDAEKWIYAKDPTLA